MGYGFKAGGGGSNPLNFKVVGGTSQPTNPKENTIWINTDKNITDWAFSADEPFDNNVEGLVWIKTAQASSAPFNALKKNNLQVYPSAVTQYVSGAWVEKTAKIYQGGAWVGFEKYLYNLDAFGKVWKTGGYKIGAESGAKAAALTVTNGSGGVLQIRQGTAAACGVAYYPDLVDLTNYSTLTFEGVISSASSGLVGLGIWTGFSTYVYEGRVAQLNSSVNGTATLDISAIKGEHYIGFWIHNTASYVNLRSIKLS